MAQTQGRGTLLKRFGLRPSRGVVLALVAAGALVLALAVVGRGLGGGTSFSIDTTGSREAAADASADSSSTKNDQVGKDADQDKAAGEKNVSDGAATTSDVVVHVDGAVANPGVYEVRRDIPRVNDAVEMAGGLVEGADTSGINLAAPLADGDKVHIPIEGEVVEATVATGAGASGSSGASGTVSGSGGGAQASGVVNINTADSATLQTLPGVGESTAAAIIEDREQKGPFATPEDLMRVSGIGEKKFAKLKERICV